MAQTKQNNLAWRVGGPQGSGVDTAARIFALACLAGRLQVFGRREYYSNIMGRHSYYDVRVAEEPMSCHRSQVHMLATFEEESLARHAVSVVPGGGLVYASQDADVSLADITFLDPRARDGLASYLADRTLPPTTAGFLEDARRRGVHTFAVDYDEITEMLAGNIEGKARAERALNTIAVAISFALLEYDPDTLTVALEEIFAAKPQVVDMNVEAVRLAYQYAAKNLEAEGFAYRLRPQREGAPMMLIGGNEAVALGKMAAGLAFQTYYPISPATDESVYLEAHATVPLQDGGDGTVVVVQTEDELAAITMASGAALTGARSATATAGPGFSLMVEGLGWAGINEVPVVVTLYQRGSPSTGVPTRTEQGDLLFAIHAGHGEFPRLVLASGDVQEAFHDAAQAFNYAERYQMPVIHLLDQGIARTTVSLPPFDPDEIRIERGEIWEPEDTGPAQGPFPRFRVTETGISPRPLLGTPGGTHWLTGAEHTEVGLVTEDPVVREQQVEKRARKLDLAAAEIPLGEKLRVYGDPAAAFTIVSWGSNKGAILEALEGLIADAIPVCLIQVRLLWPFPAAEIAPLLADAQPLVVVESNHSGQFARLLCGLTACQADHLIVKYNGRPMTCGELTQAVHEIYHGSAGERIVLRNPYE
ncbi:MAG: 2-oxoacid:acceptor oxidoreductase subunit alpha [Anaerolineae bacterium]|jgi:2-oxoglutarate ferredoxin oxidoreductase subunit alpha